MKFNRIVVVSMSCVVLSTTAYAYKVTKYLGVDRTVPAGGVLFSIHTPSFPAGSARNTALRQAVNGLDSTKVPGSSFGAGHANVSVGGGWRDGKNLLARALFHQRLNQVAGPCSADSTIALAHMRYQPFYRYNIMETDIYFNDCYDWGTYEPYDFNELNILQDGEYHLKSIAAHELGHAAGLDHFDGPRTYGCEPNPFGTDCIRILETYEGEPNTMGTVYDISSGIGDFDYLAHRVHLNEDDREGLRRLYPSSTNEGSDIAVQAITDPKVPTLLGWNDYGCDTLEFKARPEPRQDLLQRAVDEGKNYGSCPDDKSTDPFISAFPVNRTANHCIRYSLLNLGSDTEFGVQYRIRLKSAPLGNTGTVVGT